MSSREVGIEQARKTLGDLASEVLYGGHEIILTRNGKPVARLAPLRQAKARTGTPNRKDSTVNLTVTVSDVRKLLDTGNEQPVLYVNVEDGPAHIDVWAGAYVQHNWRIATRDEVTEMIGGDPTDSDIRGILGDLQETVNEIEL